MGTGVHGFNELEIVGMEQELSQMFGGRKIDLWTDAAHVISSEPFDERSFPAALGEVTGVELLLLS